MIDKDRRKKLSFHLRQLSIGRMSNDEFEDAVMEDVSHGWLPNEYYRSKDVKYNDRVIQPLLELSWSLYDDTRSHELNGSDELSREGLKIISRCILFLHSEREYEWPYIYLNDPLFRLSWKNILLSILSAGLYYREKRDQQMLSYYEWQKSGEYSIWPFYRKADYEAQLMYPPYLKG